MSTDKINPELTADEFRAAAKVNATFGWHDEAETCLSQASELDAIQARDAEVEELAKVSKAGWVAAVDAGEWGHAGAARAVRDHLLPPGSKVFTEAEVADILIVADTAAEWAVGSRTCLAATRLRARFASADPAEQSTPPEWPSLDEVPLDVTMVLDKSGDQWARREMHWVCIGWGPVPSRSFGPFTEAVGSDLNQPDHPPATPQPRSPDEIMTDLDLGLRGLADIDSMAVIFELVDDVRSSYRLAIAPHLADGSTAMAKIDAEIDDYIANHYGDN